MAGPVPTSTAMGTPHQHCTGPAAHPDDGPVHRGPGSERIGGGAMADRWVGARSAMAGPLAGFLLRPVLEHGYQR